MMFGRHERDVLLLLAARCLRMFSYGAIAVVLYMFLLNEFSSSRVAHLLMCVMIGDFFMSLMISVYADTLWGRRNALMIGAASKLLAGLSFVCFPSSYTILIVGATIGVITPTGGEIGPFLNVEQAALADISKRQSQIHVDDSEEKKDAPDELHVLSFVIAWYQVLGGLAAALGAFTAGHIVQAVEEYLNRSRTLHSSAAGNISSVESLPWERRNPVVAAMLARNDTASSFSSSNSVDVIVPDITQRHAYLVVFGLYAGIAAILLVIYSRLSEEVEADPLAISEIPKGRAQATEVADDSLASDGAIPIISDFLRDYFGLRTVSRHRDILGMAALFSIDAFAGALIVQSYIALWLSERWNVSEVQIGFALMVVNAIGGLSGFVATWLVRRIGAIRTMVFTHLPSNVLTFMIPLMPSSWSAQAMLFARYSISQMDVPARQAYVVTIVPSSERSAANGVVNSARTLGVAVAPWFLQWFLKSTSWMAAPFFIAACIKIFYDVSLYLSFRDSTDDRHGEEVGERAPLTVSAGSGTSYGTAQACRKE